MTEENNIEQNIRNNFKRFKAIWFFLLEFIKLFFAKENNKIAIESNDDKLNLFSSNRFLQRNCINRIANHFGRGFVVMTKTIFRS